MPELEGWPFVLSVLAVVGIVLLAFVFTATLAGALLGAATVLALLALVGYVLYVIGGRLHDKFRHGKPIRRGRTRSRNEGGER